jgi:hypothetical protein
MPALQPYPEEPAEETNGHAEPLTDSAPGAPAATAPAARYGRRLRLSRPTMNGTFRRPPT